MPVTEDRRTDRADASPRFAVAAEDWFAVAELEPGVHVVSEPGHVFSWLIAGAERTVLLDTGLGLADVAAAVEPFATSPVEVVNSHGHFDHVGGNDGFAPAAMHEQAPPFLDVNTDDRELAAYAAIAPAMSDDYGRLLAVDRREFFLVGPEQELRAWPAAGIAAAGGWHIATPEPGRLLSDGDVIELGDRSLRVIHTPGHCPDHICLLDEAAGILFAQDQAYYGPHLIYLPESDPGEFARSARRLADELRGAIRTVYVAHCLRPSVPPAFLSELANAAEEVAAGEAGLVPAAGLFGEPVLAADHGHFSILIAGDD